MTDSLEHLLQQLRSDEIKVFVEAATHIPQYGSEAVAPLLEVLRDESLEHVWWLAAKALGRIGNKRALEPLVALLQRPATYPSLTRKYTAWALADLGDARAVDVLIDMLHDRGWAEADDETLYQTDEPDYENVEAAARALTNIGEWRGIQAVIERLMEGDLDFDNRLDKWGGEAAFEYLCSLLTAEDSQRRAKAAYVLGLYGDKRAAEPLHTLLLIETDEQVRSAAQVALRHLWRP